MARTRKSDAGATATVEPPQLDYSVDDRIVVTEPNGEVHAPETILEIDTEDGMLRTERGWLDPKSVSISLMQSEEASVTTSVDGEEAKVVLDGTVERAAELVTPSLEDLVKSLGRANTTLAAATIAKKNASDRYKDAQGAQNAIVEEIIRHYGDANPQLKFQLNQADVGVDAPEDDAYDEEPTTEFGKMAADMRRNVNGVADDGGGEEEAVQRLKGVRTRPAIGEGPE